MSAASRPLDDAKKQATKAVRKVAPWIEKIGRFGYVAKGIVYASIGILALRSAWRYRVSVADTHGALNQLASKPQGEILLFVIGCGMFGYALWRIIEAIKDPENKGAGLRGIVERIGFVASAVVYSALGVAALKLATGMERRVTSVNEQDWTASVLSLPLGGWVVGLAGLTMLGVGIAHFYVAWTANFCKHLAYYRLTKIEKHWSIPIGRFGYAARAVVFSAIGVFFLKAGFWHDASQAGGFREALIELASQPYGLWILAGAGLGFVAYAIHLFVEATCKRFPV
jgi:hypothetical protein